MNYQNREDAIRSSNMFPECSMNCMINNGGGFNEYNINVWIYSEPTSK